MKKVMLISAPVSSRSGYGDHARDLVTSFIENIDSCFENWKPREKYTLEVV